MTVDGFLTAILQYNVGTSASMLEFPGTIIFVLICYFAGYMANRFSRNRLTHTHIGYLLSGLMGTLVGNWALKFVSITISAKIALITSVIVSFIGTIVFLMIIIRILKKAEVVRRNDA